MRESMLVTELRNEAKNEGRLEQLKQTLKTVVQGHFKTLPSEVATRIDEATDLALFQQALARVFEVSRPEEIFP